MREYDVLVIGGGSGGCASAIRSTDLGKKVALIEYRKKDGIGGTCINRGCIPTKALLKSAEVYKTINEAKKFGVEVEGASFDMKKIVKKKDSIVNNMRFGLSSFILKSRGIEIINGKAALASKNTVEVTYENGEKEILKAESIVLATGSEPAMIPAFKIDGKQVITSDDCLCMTEVPESLLIIGAGAVGIEFGTVFSSFGSKVTLVEMVDHAAPLLKDEELCCQVEKYLTKKGIDLKLGVAIKEIKAEEGKVTSVLGNGEAVETEKVLVSIGRKLNTDGLNLEGVGIEMGERGRIKVDSHMRTSVENIYAVGDIVAGPQLSHKAQREGVVAGENICGMDTEMDLDTVPWVIFSQPEIASVGISKAEAEERGIEAIEGKLPFMANEKANTMQETTGMIKIIAEKESHKIIGGKIFGPEASLLIAELALAVKNGNTLEDIGDTIHAHPTLSEGVMEAAKSGLGKAFHPQKG
ncbi:MAG: dihydrolipoyl dehydrogenase [Clostridiales bacterium]|nr:MAG: dihydrolipoyl dehydrogenase [Clostridiales bacterium]